MIRPRRRAGAGRIWASEPKRGDVAVFRLPRDTRIDYIKRVIGLPGDRIQMKDGVLHINGEAVKKEKLGVIDDPDITEEPVPVDVYQETLPNGVTYRVLDIDSNSLYDTSREYVVPEGHYFMMGDNRDNSTDSRYPQVGFVPFENFVGRANVIFFSIADGASPIELWKWPTDLRVSRLFSWVE